MGKGKKKFPSGGKSSNRTLTEERSLTSLQNSIVHVRGQIKPRRELKFIDTAQTTASLDTTGTVLLINGISEGDDFTNRNSRSVAIRSVGIRGWAFQQNAGSTQSFAQKGRVMLVWDNAVNGALPALTDILASASSVSFPNVNNEQRFTILWDRSFVVGPWSDVAASSVGYLDQAVVDVEGLVKLDAPVAFIGTGATIASLQNGGLYLVTVGSLVAGATTAATTLTTRVRFIENDSN